MASVVKPVTQRRNLAGQDFNKWDDDVRGLPPR
jgi:hypothetical protein